MSTDTYFDIMDADVFQAWKTDWDTWSRLINKGGLYKDNHVGHVHNFTCDANLDQWGVLNDTCSGQQITPELIERVATIWMEFWKAWPNGAYAEGMSTVNGIRDVLTPNMGYYLSVRVD